MTLNEVWGNILKERQSDHVSVADLGIGITLTSLVTDKSSLILKMFILEKPQQWAKCAVKR